ncbi:MAG: putative quinol monooxygenase [Clostridium sp.]|uniref:putative quinol monooxygenase n=1 Tax=Clostridium sp. TaxID=1506 RepID=UPI00290B025B|nr:putative quinol monooxygenase [Clostridium sp.]MDU7336709.1 putative quinol monooxygenase [Clostridium sp.]
MIKLVAQNTIKADKVEAFIELATQLVHATRENDTGCIRYELLQDVKNPQVLTMLEEWEDEAALSRHGASQHFKEAIAKFAEYMEKPGETHLYKTLV